MANTQNDSYLLMMMVAGCWETGDVWLRLTLACSQQLTHKECCCPWKTQHCCCLTSMQPGTANMHSSPVVVEISDLGAACKWTCHGLLCLPA